MVQYRKNTLMQQIYEKLILSVNRLQVLFSDISSTLNNLSLQECQSSGRTTLQI